MRYAKLLLIGLVVLGTSGYGDIAAPGQVNCAVTSVQPVGARFFGFGKGPVVGDKLTQDFNVAKIGRLKFESGAVIGSSVTVHELERLPLSGGAENGFTAYEVKFKSHSNGHEYIARLQAIDDDKKTKVNVALDVLEMPSYELDRFQLNSLEMVCTR